MWENFRSWGESLLSLRRPLDGQVEPLGRQEGVELRGEAQADLLESRQNAGSGNRNFCGWEDDVLPCLLGSRELRRNVSLQGPWASSWDRLSHHRQREVPWGPLSQPTIVWCLYCGHERGDSHEQNRQFCSLGPSLSGLCCLICKRRWLDL